MIPIVTVAIYRIVTNSHRATETIDALSTLSGRTRPEAEAHGEVARYIGRHGGQ